MLYSVLYSLGGACTDFLKSLLLFVPLEIIFICYARKRRYHISARHITGVCFFQLLLLFIFILTGVPSLRQLLEDGLYFWPDSLNLIPFTYIGEDVVPYILNIVLFIPFGFLCPLLWKSKRFWYRTVLAGFSLSLLIEVSQIFTFRVTDIDDLLMNTLGTCIGFFVFVLFRKLAPYLSNAFALENGGGFPVSKALRREQPILVTQAFLSSFVLLPFLAAY
ncbi:VanZ family protein [Bariatricus massiliensis]|uniref:VanZ family protein n=1 Tax=Bariatricus massiliensis TaxID=1745713 RepID=A0ABS8DI16_9FIRM|nr:VanZ family protein [Bariatricus massiliensis]MCB7304642.1 VanZ family protein [Bariatricus massiliensis]MCB7374793.1 VanZ family protein [Bariatricus massiliensis]MCB7388080.1 VanZ family protein [Bariatricus massiliensis]MCB7411958.1 VanZ family protein [Bariatricus massiliensis]MCQ5254251.1 VanZ family protein [Bariatricus massiliensis]